jgi:hypothetical protein
MGIPAPEIQKFMPLWMFYGGVAIVVVTLLVVVFVLSTTRSRSGEETK